jgi:hypothetical protein
MDSAFKDGGLYCGNVVSKDKSDYKRSWFSFLVFLS